MNAHDTFWKKHDINGSTATDDELTPIKHRELAQMWYIPYTASFAPSSIAAVAPPLRESKQLNEPFVQLLMQFIGLATPAYSSAFVDNGDYHWINDLPAAWLNKGTVND